MDADKVGSTSAVTETRSVRSTAMVAEFGNAIPKALHKKIETEFDSIITLMK
jgi:hypothetical protein